ncbi:class I SAM-dependent methyltransferase [Myxococcus sp. CA051A]|uniref:class I SAM-dependent methyltransferase n=1 Tax=unclassified Myxococcus TaxID=2648731 RepID=UPI00157B548F|nr:MULTISPECIES: class I SAM-dependent methyltransferase [unclassified Myxococcus]NTX41082.1 class I SAM-dependent methyltransferase [Myxococcus sp. CA033]NTX53811.1 class I SAM-dependent methyltransferase [Myxococcus sp. CA039A]NTX64260.1 class I SAM-dependent methyltransferase [Myxococcus sp. CA051A]
MTTESVDVRKYNREAWDRQVAAGDRWTVPVTPEVIAAAKRGEWSIVLTPTKPVPREWFGDVTGKRVLCLAGAGGQQAPVLAAAGARVTVLDNSPAQLGQDRKVAEREGLELRLVEGDMKDLSAFEDGSFDLIFHPCSNAFVDDVRPVWREAFRVLRPGGALLSGFSNPVIFLFDPDLQEQGVMQLKYKMPYSDFTSLTDAERSRYTDKGEPLCVGHSLQDQMGGQLDAGFLLAGFFEDRHVAGDKLSEYFEGFIATRAVKPGAP